MLIGEFESKLTLKNRIAVPKKIRLELQDGLIISRGYEGCLILLDKARWVDLLDLISREPILNLSVRDTRRFIMGGASEIDLDGQGRFVLPSQLKSYATLDDDVVFIGLNDWVEIWDKDIWNTKLDILKVEASDIAEKLLKLNDKHNT